MDGMEAGAALNASLLLDGEDKILEGNRDAEVFLERPLDEVRKTHLSRANPSLYTALKELIDKTRRGRGVEDYALSYKVSKRLLRLNISVTPYPLEALGATGTLVIITTPGGRPSPERYEPRKPKPPTSSKPAAAKETMGLKQLLDSLSEPAFILDMEAVFTYVNPVMGSLLGHAEEEIIGRPLSFFMLREEAKRALDYLVEAARSAPWRGELEFSRGDGTTSNISVAIDVLKAGRDKADEADSLLGIGRDNSVETRIRREREEELKRVWNLLERLGLAIACFTPDSRVTLLSHSAGELLKTTSDRAIGTPLPDLFPGDTSGGIASLIDLSVKGEEVKGAEVRMGRIKGEKRGDDRTLLVEVKPADLAEGKPREYMMILREATQEMAEVEKAEMLLEESSTRVKLLEIAVANREPGAFLDSSLGILQEELACPAAAAFILNGRDCLFEVGRGLDGADQEILREFRLRPGYARECEKHSKFIVEIHGGVPKKGWKDMHSLIEKADMLLPLFREKRWRRLLIQPFRGEEVIGVLTFADYDRDRLARCEERLLPAICETVASVLPTLVVGKAESEEKEATAHRPHQHEEEHDLLEHALEAKKVKPSQNHLSLWGEDVEERVSPSQKEVDVTSLAWELKEYYSRRGRKGEVFLELEDDLPGLYADKRLLRESLMQLLENAMRYSPPGSPVILGVERWGDEVLLRIEDQGPGIPREVIDEVMRADLMDTEGGGSQSGLFRTRKQVMDIGGELTIKGKPEEGTTVFIRLGMPTIPEEGQ